MSDLTAEVLRLYPTLTSDVSKLVVAVNEEYQDHSHTLHDGDETALIPPVSGGVLRGTPRPRGIAVEWEPRKMSGSSIGRIAEDAQHAQIDF